MFPAHPNVRSHEASVWACHFDVRYVAHRCDLQTGGHLEHTLASVVSHAGWVGKSAAALVAAIHPKQRVGQVPSNAAAKAVGFAPALAKADPAVLETCLKLAVDLETAHRLAEIAALSSKKLLRPIHSHTLEKESALESCLVMPKAVQQSLWQEPSAVVSPYLDVEL